MRSFIAIDIPEEIKSEIVKIQKKLSESGLFSGKLTERENLHLTLKFLGELSEKEIEEVKSGLKNIKLEKFKASFGKLGVFSESFIRIIWIELENCGKLQGEIDKKLEGLFAKENRFMSHLTIARVKKVEDRKKLIDEIEKIKINKEFDVSEFKLKKSTLTEKGPIYEDIENYYLN